MQIGQTPVRSRTELYEAMRTDYVRADRTVMHTSPDGSIHKVDHLIGEQLVTYSDLGLGTLRTCIDPHGTFEQVYLKSCSTLL